MHMFLIRRHFVRFIKKFHRRFYLSAIQGRDSSEVKVFCCPREGLLAGFPLTNAQMHPGPLGYFLDRTRNDLLEKFSCLPVILLSKAPKRSFKVFQRGLIARLSPAGKLMTLLKR